MKDAYDNNLKILQHLLPYRTGPMIKKLRKERCMTQQQLANNLNTSRSCVGNWEACLRVPSAEQYYALAKLFDVDISVLF